MIDSLEIRGFRCFDHFEAKNLARVNLLVGTNNCGKTSLLEAVEMWSAQNTPDALVDVLARRNERLAGARASYGTPEFTVRHLFRGHLLEPSRAFEIAATRHGSRQRLRVVIEHDPTIGTDELYVDRSQQAFAFSDEELTSTEVREGTLTLRFISGVEDRASLPNEGSSAVRDYSLRLSPEGGLSLRSLRRVPQDRGSVSAAFVPTRSLGVDRVASMFGEIVLTDEEPLIIRALQSIEPTIERVALAVDETRTAYGRTGLFVRCKGEQQRIPIGSMGDGIWRLLTLALALVNTRGGILLIDEIDTGLHFSVMFDMWKLVIETAQRLDVQVFATTHSRDCYESLAAVLREMETAPGTAVIHRIERERGRTVTFDEQQIVIAAERGIEVR